VRTFKLPSALSLTVDVDVRRRGHAFDDDADAFGADLIVMTHHQRTLVPTDFSTAEAISSL
jgi:hypothetical protein